MGWLVKAAATAAIVLTASSTAAEAARCNVGLLQGVWTGSSTLGTKLADHCTLYFAQSDGRLDNSLCTGVVVLPIKVVTGRLFVNRNCEVTGRLIIDTKLVGKQQFNVTGELDQKRNLLSLHSKKNGRIDLLRFMLTENP